MGRAHKQIAAEYGSKHWKLTSRGPIHSGSFDATARDHWTRNGTVRPGHAALRNSLPRFRRNVRICRHPFTSSNLDLMRADIRIQNFSSLFAHCANLGTEAPRRGYRVSTPLLCLVRTECLDAHWFGSLAEPKAIIETWCFLPSAHIREHKCTPNVGDLPAEPKFRPAKLISMFSEMGVESGLGIL